MGVITEVSHANYDLFAADNDSGFYPVMPRRYGYEWPQVGPPLGYGYIIVIICSCEHNLYYVFFIVQWDHNGC